MGIGEQMKELKALEILKNIRKVIEVSQYNNSGVTFGKATLFECDEAVAELEALQTSTTCDKCKYNDGIRSKTVCQTCDIFSKSNYVAKEFL